MAHVAQGPRTLDPESAPVPAPDTVAAVPDTGVPVMSVEGLAKSYKLDNKSMRHAIADVSLEVFRGEFVCIVGSSGVGKTTLIKCLAGLIKPSKGVIRFEGEPIDGTPRGLGLVFQEYGRSLFPWWTVERNVTLGLRGRRMSRSARKAAAQTALEAVGLHGVGDSYPWQLSGGMQQRVAIARALAYEAELLLMDEPFASVDAQTRYELEDLVLSLNETTGLTVLFVTHDIDEAVYLGDRIVVLGGSPSNVRAVIDVDLPRPRNQHDTKSDPRFTALRTQVLELLPTKAEAKAARDRQDNPEVPEPTLGPMEMSNLPVEPGEAL
jgi:NitT/TauT family transport system ATP-binding protein